MSEVLLYGLNFVRLKFVQRLLVMKGTHRPKVLLRIGLLKRGWGP